MKTTPFDLTRTPKTGAEEITASVAINKAVPSRDNKRYIAEGGDEDSRQPELEEESEEELLRQLGLLELEQAGGNFTEQTSEELDLEIELLEQAGGNSTEPRPEDASLIQELKQLEQAEEKSTEPTPEELDLEIDLIEQNLKKQDEEKLAQDKGNFSPLITPSINPTDLLGGISAKEGAAAKWELGEEKPEMENRNRPGFFTRIGNMRSISSFCRSLLPNRGAAAEGELVVEEAHKQDCNEEQMGLVEMGKLLKITKEDTHKALEDARKALKERAAENKKSEQRIEALREKQARGESGPSAISARSKATTVSNPPNPRQNPKR